MTGLFGGLLRQAIIGQQWQKLPPAVKQCMAQKNMPIEALAAQGISPADPSVHDVLAECESQNHQSPPAPTVQTQDQALESANYAPRFVVNGLALGGPVNPQSDSYRSFQCKPSDQFPGYTICHRDRLLRDGLRSVEAFLHSSSGTAYYVSQVIFPAMFRPGDINREIEVLSEHFGLKPQILRSDNHPGFPHGVIAYWGGTLLTPLGPDDIGKIRHNIPIKRGFLFDFYDNYKDSANANSPIYQLSGEAGYVWGATYDDSGRGRLRLVTIDPSAFMASEVSASAFQGDTSNDQSSSAPAASSSAEDDAKKKEDLERLTAEAKGIVADASTFIKSSPNNPKLLQYVQEIAQLSAAISSQDPDEIRRLSSQLTNDLSTEADYQTLQKERAANEKRDEARFLGEALLLAKHQLHFLIQTVRDDPTSPDTLQFVQLINSLKGTQTLDPNQDLDSVRKVTGNADLAIRGAGLYDKFVAFEANDSNETGSRNVVSGTAVSSQSIPVTDRNRFLVEGDLADIVILYNASSSAPDIALNLRNEYVFSNGRAVACVVGKLTNSGRLAVKTRIMKLNPQKLSGLNLPCDLGHLNLYDLVIAQRGEFLKEAPADALLIVAALENQQYRQLFSITSKEMQTQADVDRQEIAAITTDVRNGVRTGYGLILLKNGSSVVCLTESDKVEAHSHLLLKVADGLAVALNGDPSISQISLDDAFANSQKGKCGAIYADAAALKEIDSELSRMNIQHSFLNIWISPDQVDAADKVIRDQQHSAEVEAQKRAQRLEDQAKLEAARKVNESATAEAQQAQFRAKYGARANAEAAAISAEISTWTTQQKGTAQEEFPAYANWVSDELADHWEFQDINSEVADFGTSNFKGRQLETIIARVTLNWKNRLLGEYDKPCFLFGRINDTEFSIVREPFVVKCDDTTDLEHWEQGHQFASQWITK